MLRHYLPLFLVTLHLLGGCASTTTTTGPQSTDRIGPGKVTPETVNAMVLAFADDHVLRILEAVDTMMARVPNLEDRSRLSTLSLQNAQSTFGIATASNPVVGMSDMVVMVSLSREAIRRSAIDPVLTDAERREPGSYVLESDQIEGMFGSEERLMYRAFSASEREIRVLAERVLWPEQVSQLDALMAEWWEKNPERRLVSNVRLQDFAGYRAARVETASSGPRNLLALLYLDPLASMDPTTREIAQTRMLAERVTWQINRMPMIVSMHARGLMYESFTTQEFVSVRETLEETEDSIERFADAVDRWPEEVAAERQAAIEQLQAVVAAERELAIEQLAEVVREQRAGLVADVEAAVARQRDETLAQIEAQIEAQTGPFQETLSKLNTTLDSANTLSGSVNDTVRAIDEMDVANFQQLVETTTDGVGGLERSLNTVERMLAPETIDASTTGIDNSVTLATASTKELVDYIYRRGLMFAGLVLVGCVIAVLAVKLIGARLTNRPAA